MRTIVFIFSFFFALRLISLFISIRNEKRLKAIGAIQYGKLNSLLLTIAHIAFYACSLLEAYESGTTFNNISFIGLILLIFAYSVLFYVIYELRAVWTLKIYIAPEHKVIQSFLFRWVKHPNYFLNIIPELIGIALLCQSYNTLFIGLPTYAIFLIIRIIQEEKAMKKIHK